MFIIEVYVYPLGMQLWGTRELVVKMLAKEPETRITSLEVVKEIEKIKVTCNRL